MGISIFLTGSGTGVVVYILIMALYLLSKIKITQYSYYTVGAMVPVFLVLLWYFLPRIVGRATIITTSLYGRLNIFIETFEDTGFISDKFGLYTNTAVLLSKRFSFDTSPIIADSLIASTLGNLGLIGACLVAVVLHLSLIRIILREERLEIFTYAILFGLFSCTTIMTEAFPMNLIFSILTGYYLFHFGKKKSQCDCIGKQSIVSDE